MISSIIDIILHIDKYLNILILAGGILTYLILFLIIFMETAFVLTPFLPGDSLLFVSGAFAAARSLDITILFIMLAIAAIIGDTYNYFIGNYFGEKIFSKYLNKKYMERTRLFYKKHGKKTIALARFVPIVRTFAPFIAGIGKMRYLTFLSYNIIGGLAWVALFLFAGYFFGNIPFVKDNLSVFIFLIIAVSFIPVVIEYLKSRKENEQSSKRNQKV